MIAAAEMISPLGTRVRRGTSNAHDARCLASGPSAVGQSCKRAEEVVPLHRRAASTSPSPRTLLLRARLAAVNITLGLRVAALWNLMAGGMLLMPELGLRLFFGLEAPQPGAVMVLFYTVWFFVLALGAAYGIASANLRFRDGILIVGAIGKSSIFLLWTAAFAFGQGTPLLFLGGVGDLAWAAFFVWILRSTTRSP